ncbi:hypothetical protein ABK040_003726 [Willaertia magna]
MKKQKSYDYYYYNTLNDEISNDELLVNNQNVHLDKNIEDILKLEISNFKKRFFEILKDFEINNNNSEQAPNLYVDDEFEKICSNINKNYVFEGEDYSTTRNVKGNNEKIDLIRNEIQHQFKIFYFDLMKIIKEKLKFQQQKLLNLEREKEELLRNGLENQFECKELKEKCTILGNECNELKEKLNKIENEYQVKVDLLELEKDIKTESSTELLKKLEESEKEFLQKQRKTKRNCFCLGFFSFIIIFIIVIVTIRFLVRNKFIH